MGAFDSNEKHDQFVAAQRAEFDHDEAAARPRRRPPSGHPLVGSISAVRCTRCGFVSPEPADGDIECCWKGPDWQRVLIVPIDHLGTAV